MCESRDPKKSTPSCVERTGDDHTLSLVPNSHSFEPVLQSRQYNLLSDVPKYTLSLSNAAEPKTGLAICLIHLIIPLGLEEMYRKITAAFKPGWYKGLPDGPYIGDDDE